MPLRAAVRRQVDAGRQRSSSDGPRVRSQSTAGRKRGRVGHADGPDGEAGGGDVRRSRQRGDDAAKVRPRPDGFAIDRGWRTATPKSEPTPDGALSARPSDPAIGRDDDAGAAYGGARRRADAADGYQGGRSDGSSQVVPAGAAVRRADHMGAGGQARGVAGARDPVEGGGCGWCASAGPRWNHRSTWQGSRASGPPDDTPTAVQCRESGHEMPVKLVTIPGIRLGRPCRAAIAVAMMLGAELPKSLTA